MTFIFTSTGLTSATSNTFDITQSPATQLAFVAQPTDAVAGVNISPAITVEARDANGTIVPTFTSSVTLAFNTDPSAGVATLGGTLSVNAVSGIATFSDINVDRAFTSYDLSAASTGLTSATSASFNISAATKSQLVFNVEPTYADQNVNISPSIVVEIQDAFGNRTADTDSITLAINNNPAGGTLSGTASVNAVSGQATFTDINIDNTGVGYTLDATATGLTTATSAAFNINAVPTQLVITQQPSNVGVGANITPAITVEIRDASNNLVSGSTATVSVAIGTNPGGGTLSGSTSIAAVGGIATFSDLNIDAAGSGYTLSFTSTGLTGATSSTFNVNLVATQLVITQDPANTERDAVIAPNITVELRDASNNLVTSATNSVTIAISADPSAGSAVLGGSTTVSAVAGVATFNSLTIDTIGSGYSLQVTSGALTADTTTTFDITQPPATQLVFVQTQLIQMLMPILLQL